MQSFSCENCAFYRSEGWAFFRGKGGPIHEGPCWQYSFYNHEAARRACGGRLKSPSPIRPHRPPLPRASK